MQFIGILAPRKKEASLKRNLENTLKNIEEERFQILTITIQNIEHLKNIKFDTIWIQEIEKWMIEEKENLEKILLSATLLVLNTDHKMQFTILKEKELTYITYGLNPKATITTSSMEDDKILVCIQRKIQFKDKTIEPQEIWMEKYKQHFDLSDQLGIISIQLLYTRNKTIVKDIQI